MRIDVLVENEALEGRANLVPEFGLSLHVEVGGKRILFDTGSTGVFVDNAAALGIDVAAVDLAVLSHHHFDHGGGLARFFEVNRSAKVYLRDVPPEDRYFKAFAVIKKPIGLDPTLFERFPDRFEPIDGFTEIAPGVFLITEIGTAHRRPGGNRRLFVERDGRLVRDPFDHELVMVIREGDGIVVFTGCSHSGVLNMVASAAGRFPGAPIRAVVGGFHLMGLPQLNSMGASRREVSSIGRQLLELGPGTVYTAHCTGGKAYEVLRDVMGDTLRPFHTGSRIEA